MPDLILASSSTYRSELLKKLRIDFLTCASYIEEQALDGESASAMTRRLAVAKAQSLSDRYDRHLIIGCDQAAVCKDQLLGKPGTRARAIEQLTAQSGNCVDFHTAVCVFNSATGVVLVDEDVCQVYFRVLARDQIERYVDAEQPYDCAGSFKSEGFGICLFEKIVGDDPNALIGLPLIKLIRLLDQCGLPLP